MNQNEWALKMIHVDAHLIYEEYDSKIWISLNVARRDGASHGESHQAAGRPIGAKGTHQSGGLVPFRLKITSAKWDLEDGMVKRRSYRSIWQAAFVSPCPCLSLIYASFDSFRE